MNPRVALQAFFARESLPALSAFEELQSRVPYLVSFPVGLVRKTLLAVLTSEWLLAGMDSAVPLQIGSRKFLPANIAKRIFLLNSCNYLRALGNDLFRYIATLTNGLMYGLSFNPSTFLIQCWCGATTRDNHDL